jgi:hypothetical protein
MKTNIKFAGLLILLMSGIGFSTKAQTYTLTNNLNCPVELFYEARNATCGTPSSGPIILTQGNPVVINVNPNVIGVCLIIRQIGSATAPGNHLWIRMNNSTVTPCHNVSYGQSGTTTGCSLPLSYTVTLTPNSWTIN